MSSYAPTQISRKVSVFLANCTQFERMCNYTMKSVRSCNKLSSKHAIFNARNVSDHHINSQLTVNLCMVEISEAFDKMNHYALFLKLLKRNFLIRLVNVFVQWFNMSTAYVRWGILSLLHTEIRGK